MSRFDTYVDFVCFEGGNLLTATPKIYLQSCVLLFTAISTSLPVMDFLGVVLVVESALQLTCRLLCNVLGRLPKVHFCFKQHNFPSEEQN